MNESYSLTDGVLASASARHRDTMARLHSTVHVNIATGDIRRGIRVSKKAQMPFRSNDRDEYGHRNRSRDARDAIERLWQQHRGKMEHFDDADRLPTAQWAVVSRDALSRPQYRLVGVTNETTLEHDCTKHWPTDGDGGSIGPVPFVLPHTGFRRVA